MLFQPPDLAFSADDSHSFLPWMIGIMTGVMAFLLCFGLTVNFWMLDRQTDYDNSFTISIPVSDELSPESKEAVFTLLKTRLENATINELSTDKLGELLKPWIGNAANAKELPLPWVLEVSLPPDESPVNYSELQQALSEIVTSAEVDTQEEWATAFAGFSRSIQYISLMLAALLIGAMIMMIAFTSRASLKLHSRNVQLLHSIGAEDRYIAGQFQQEAFRLALPAALVGCAVAALLYWGMGKYMTSLDLASLPSLSLTQAHAFLLMALPPACALTAWLVARFAIVSQLQKNL